MTNEQQPLLHQRALGLATNDLVTEYEGVFNRQTIEEFVTTTYEEFASRARVTTFLAVSVERFVRERLRALARIEHHTDSHRPAVLFLCVHNAGRSQMALGWFHQLAGDRAIGWSGGTEPGSEVNPAAVTAMAEVGIDITEEFPKPWTDEIVRAADVVITMGCGDSCPLFPGKHYEDWDLNDPEGQTLDTVRAIRDDIGQRVRQLVSRLGVETEAHHEPPAPVRSP